MFEIAINRWAFPSTLSYPEVFRLAKQAGFEAVEITTTGDELTPDSPEGVVREIARAAQQAEIKICSYAGGEFWTNGFTVSDPVKRDRGIEIARKMLQQAVWVGTDAILCVPGWVSVPWIPDAEVVPYELACERAAAALKQLAPEAENLGVTIGVENVWNGMLLSPLEFREFIDSIASPRVQVYFDTGNAVAFGFPEDWIRTLGSRICRVHIKDFRRSVGTLQGFVPPLEGDVNWPVVVRALAEARYAGPLTAERSPARFCLPAVLEQTRIALEAIRQMGS
jgi:L-ribulose-5-phosphate 3-epimerase